MKALFRLHNTDKIDASMTLTMPLGEWKELANALNDLGWPACNVRTAILSLVEKAAQEFEADGER